MIGATEQTRTRAPGKWEARLTPRIFAQVRQVGAPRWLDDERVAYVQDHNGRADIYVTDGDGSHGSPQVSPDGRQVAFIADRAEQTAIAVAGTEGDDWPRRASRGDGVAIDPQWSPDGERLAYAEFDEEGYPWHHTRIKIARLSDGTSESLIDWAGAATTFPRWSPDGTRIVFVSDRSGWANLWLADVASGEARQLVTDTWEHAEPVWSPDGHTIVYTRNVDGNFHLMAVGLDGGEPRVLADAPGLHGGATFSPDGTRLLFTHQSPTSPPNVYVMDATGGERRSLTRNTVGGLDAAGLILPTSITYPSSDGFTVHAVLYVPEQRVPGRHPLLAQIHGGPTAQTTWRWDPVVQYYVQRGWVVVATNFRGSTGYGRAYTDAMHGRWGEIDMEDNVHAVYYLDREGLIDRRRAVAWGGSGGGLATLSLLTQKPEVFKAGVDLYGVSNFVSFGEQTDRLARHLFPSELGPMAENFALYEQNSPVNHADKVKAPLLIFQGLEDKRVPPRQSEEMVEALQKAGKLVEYVTYEGEGHGWRKVDTVLDYMAKMEAFLTKYVIER